MNLLQVLQGFTKVEDHRIALRVEAESFDCIGGRFSKTVSGQSGY